MMESLKHYAIMQGRVGLRDACALNCVSKAVFTLMGTRVANFESCRAGHMLVASATDCYVKDDTPDGQPRAQAQHM